MVYKIAKLNNRHKVFIETLVLTLLILIIGFSLGFYVEYYRTRATIENYKFFEIESLDLRLQNYYYQIMDSVDCEIAIKENLNFADRVYDTGLRIEKYEEANELTGDLLLEKKKYVLLKTELWLNSLLLKKKCNNPFHTIVYFYSKDNSLPKEAEQEAISNILKEVKEEKGNKVILLPIAGDLGLPSVDMQMRIYNITYLPSTLIDEEFILESFYNKEKITQYLS